MREEAAKGDLPIDRGETDHNRLIPPFSETGDPHETADEFDADLQAELARAASFTPSSSSVATESSLSAKKIFAQSGGLSAASIIVAAISLPTMIVVAHWVGPRQYGMAEWVLLFYFYATLLRTGVFEGGIRQFIHDGGASSLQAVESRNIGFSWELVASAIPGLIMVPLAFVLGSPLKELGFILAPLAIVGGTAASMYGGMFLAERKPRVVAVATLLQGFVNCTAVLIVVHWFGAAGIFIAPTLASLCTVVFYIFSRHRVHVSWDFNRPEGRRLLAAGFPLGVSSVFYWIYRMVGSTAIALFRSSLTFGLYAFAVAPITVLTTAIAMTEGVITPALWGEMAADTDNRDWEVHAKRLTVTLAIIAALVVNVSQAGFAPLVHLLLPRFIGSIPIFYVLALSIWPLSILTVPSLVLTSVPVGRQQLTLWMTIGALAVNIVANAVVLLRGGGAVAIAWNDVWIQLVGLAVMFEFAAPHYDPGIGRFRTYVALGGIAACMGFISWLLHSWLNGPGSREITIFELVERVVLVAAVWLAIGGAWLLMAKWQNKRTSASPN